MAAKKKKASTFGRNIPFGHRKSLTIQQRKSIPDIDNDGKMSKLIKSGEDMSPKERRDYVSKVKADIRQKMPKKPHKKSHLARPMKKHNTYHK